MLSYNQSSMVCLYLAFPREHVGIVVAASFLHRILLYPVVYRASQVLLELKAKKEQGGLGMDEGYECLW